MTNHTPNRLVSFYLLLMTGFLVLTGLVLVYSAGSVSARPVSDLFTRQLLWCAIGAACLVMCRRIKPEAWVRGAPALFLATLAVLVIVLFIGQGRATRWLRIGFFNFQPSEFAKIVFIIMMAWFLDRKRRRITSPGTTLASLFVLLPPLLLILLQPNLGTAFLLVPVFFAMLYLAGTPRGHLALMAGAGLASLPVLWLFLREYQRSRIMVFLNPGLDPLGAGYNIIQSRIAIGSGGLLGKGFLQGTQTHLAFLPEHHTDFIFSVLAEEWGLVGCLALIIVYLAFVFLILRVGSYSRNRAAALMTGGFATLFAVQASINMAMTMGFLPVVGIPLPLISYGGSSLVVSCAAIGIVLAIQRQNTR